MKCSERVAAEVLKIGATARKVAICRIALVGTLKTGYLRIQALS
jgi:hypothetical protein